jgi:hypothetical protein
VTHDPDLAARSNRSIRVADGEIVDQVNRVVAPQRAVVVPGSAIRNLAEKVR